MHTNNILFPHMLITCYLSKSYLFSIGLIMVDLKQKYFIFTIFILFHCIFVAIHLIFNIMIFFPQLLPFEVERQERRREQNRRAAKKFRQKRRQTSGDLNKVQLYILTGVENASKKFPCVIGL